MATTSDTVYHNDFHIEPANTTGKALTYRLEFSDERIAESMLAALNVAHELLRDAWNDSQRERLETLTRALVEARMPLSAAAQKQADMAADLRLRLFRDYGGLLSTEEVAENAHSRARNRAALASKWKREGLIFTVAHEGREQFPAFQFDTDSGRPLAAIQAVLAVANATLLGWPLVYWLLTPNSWLAENACPIDCLLSGEVTPVTNTLTQQLNRADSF